MSFDYRILCCHVVVDTAILATVETIVIICVYLTGFQHPLMRCKTFNAAVLEHYAEPIILAEHKICTTNGPLLFWIIIHLFTNLLCLVSLYTKTTKLLFGYLFVTSLDLLISLAYLVVLLVFVAIGDDVDKVLMIFMISLFIFKLYQMLSGRRLYWYFIWINDNILTPRSMLMKANEENVFQF